MALQANCPNCQTLLEFQPGVALFTCPNCAQQVSAPPAAASPFAPVGLNPYVQVPQAAGTPAPVASPPPLQSATVPSPPAAIGAGRPVLVQTGGAIPPGFARHNPFGTFLLLTIVTFGVYLLIYLYRAFRDLRHFGNRGPGETTYLLVMLASLIPCLNFIFRIWLLVLLCSLPSWIRQMFEERGEISPITGYACLWLFAPVLMVPIAFGSFVVIQGPAALIPICGGFAFIIAANLFFYYRLNESLNMLWPVVTGRPPTLY